MAKSKIKLLIDGGKATPGPPLGPALAPLGVNPGQVVAQINTATKQYEGMKVPVVVIVDTSTKTAEVTVGAPPTSAMIKKELHLELGAKGEPEKGQETIGNLTLKQIEKIAKSKADQMIAKNFTQAMKQVIGTCKSMGVTVEGMNPIEALRAIESGSLKL